MKTAQINFRIEPELKAVATEKARKMGINLNQAVRLFLVSFAHRDDVLRVSYDVNPDAVFDEGVKLAFLSPKGVRTTKEINALLEGLGE